MKKFKFLIKYGLKKRIFRKSFLIANLVIAVLFVGIVNLPTIIGWFGNGDDQTENVSVDVYNQTTMDTIGTDLEYNLNLPYEGYEFFEFEDVTQSFDEDAFWETENAADVSLIISGDISSPVIAIYSKVPEYNQMIMSEIEMLIINYQIVDYQSPVFETIMAPDYEDPDNAAAISSLMSLLVLPLFVLITMATQFVGVDIIEEKSTKAIETIIASVPAKLHFLSKITSSILFVLIQGLLIIVYGGIAALLGNINAAASAVVPTGVDVHLLKYLAEILPNWPMVLFIALLFIIVGTLFYLVIAALFASMAVTQEDYQQFQSPLMLMLVGGFYITIFAPMVDGYGFMKIMAFIPIFTPMVAPVAFASGIMSIGEALIALAIMLLALVSALYIVAPVYKIAILSYDQTKFVKRIKSYFKKAFSKNKKEEIES